MVKNILVLGGGSAGFLAALTLKKKVRDLDVGVVRSPDIGIIGVGEGTTVVLPEFLHELPRHRPRSEFYEVAEPTWKLGMRFLWGPRPYFHYTFGPQLDRPVARPAASPSGYYCDDDVEYADRRLRP